MFLSSALVARGSEAGSPQACKPFSIHSNVCVGDLVAILACGIAGIGFFFWAIHAIRKMRQSPFNHKIEDKEKLDDKGERSDHYHGPSVSGNRPVVQRDVVQTPSLPKRVRTRMLPEHEEDLYGSLTPIQSGTHSAQGLTTMPRAPRHPPPAVGQWKRTSLHRSGRHGSSTRRGVYGEKDEYGADSEYFRDGSGTLPLHRSRTGYGSYQSREYVMGP